MVPFMHLSGIMVIPWFMFGQLPHLQDMERVHGGSKPEIQMGMVLEKSFSSVAITKLTQQPVYTSMNGMVLMTMDMDPLEPMAG